MISAVLLVLVGVVAAVLASSSSPSSARKGASGRPGTTPASTTTATSAPALPTYTPAQVAQRVDPAIVDVNTVTQVPAGYAYTAGTGMIISPDGYILTNNHVVEGATTIRVTIAGHSGARAAAFVGADPAADVALVKVSGMSDLPTVKIGSSAGLSVGAPVVAIGNALGRGGVPKMTSGSILALNRTVNATDQLAGVEHLTGMIVASSTIEPGNSGGPLLDEHAEVIGMNTADNSAGPGNDFAIPVDRAMQVASDIENGRPGQGVVLGRQAFLGLAVRTVDGEGVLVTRAIPGYPAPVGGVQPGDFIVAFDGKAVATADQLRALVTGQRVGATADLTYRSQLGTSRISLRLAPGPAA